jgi:hypothetical protein
MTILISVDFRNMLFVDGEPLNAHVTKQEHIILRTILSHERVATREFLLSAAYGGRDEPDIKILDVFVTKLRAKLGVHRVAIETVWGRGYCRNPLYAMAPEHTGITVGVDTKLLDEIIMVRGGTPEQVIAKLVEDEHRRIWDAEAA